ncbi:MAG: MarR family transcriptional regulator [Thermoanaerobaculia bacterium]
MSRQKASTIEQESELALKARELMSHIETLGSRFLQLEKKIDLSRSEALLLRFIAGHGRTSMSELSSQLDLACSSSTGIVDRLVERGLVERFRPQENRRTVLVELTTRGRHLHQKIGEERASLGTAMLEPLDPHEREQLLDLFRKITSRV